MNRRPATFTILILLLLAGFVWSLVLVQSGQRIVEYEAERANELAERLESPHP